MTSNLGSHLIAEKIAAGFGGNGTWSAEFELLKKQLLQLLRQTIRPEFLNRIDEVIVFRPLGPDDLRRVVSIQLLRVSALLERKGIVLRFDDAARDWLAREGFEPAFGARPLKRVIQRHVIDVLSGKILSGELAEGEVVEIGADAKGLSFRKATA
jgi:ATP-dependent Clp protease ATP-binding subunit ClpB